MPRILKKNGFASIVEVIVTAIVFILATAGILTTISMLQPHSRESSVKMEGAYIGKGILDELRKDVDAGSWGSGNLTLGFHSMPPVGIYNVSYTVTEPISDLRHLNMTVTWPDY